MGVRFSLFVFFGYAIHQKLGVVNRLDCSQYESKCHKRVAKKLFVSNFLFNGELTIVSPSMTVVSEKEAVMIGLSFVVTTKLFFTQLDNSEVKESKRLYNIK